MFQIRGEQFVALRRKKIGDALIERVSPFVKAAAWDTAGETILLEDALGPRGHIGFDTLGYLASYTSPLGRTWQLANLPDGKPLHIASPSGHVVSMAYNEDGLLASFATSTQAQTNLFYDRRRWTGSTHADGTYERLEYTFWDGLERLTDRLGTAVTCTHDEHQRLTALTDGNGSKTQFLYGKWSRPDAVIYPNGSGESYTYDAEGRLAGVAQGDVTVAVETNAAGRPLKLTYSDGTVLQYAYDDLGMVTAATLGEEKAAFTYNEWGQVVEETSGGLTHTFAYDAAHRLVATNIFGRAVQFRWDADSRLVGFTDWNGSEHTLEHLPGDRGYVTSAPALHGMPGVRSFTQLDLGGRLASLNVTAAGESRFSLSCSYDAEGRLSTSTDNTFGRRAFTYDAAGKLLYGDASTPERREAFGHDRAGNLLVRNGQRFAYDAANQLLQCGDERMSWDDRGNLIARSGPQGTWRFRYNARNHLIASIAPEGIETTYTYDALSRRTAKRTGTVETRFLWAGEQLAAELRIDLAQGSVRRQDFLYHPETGAPLATAVDGEVYTVHTDHLGTPRAVLSAAGAVVWLAELSAFGQATVVVDQLPMPLRFRGQYHDPETGLHYNRFRYYAPQWGRYLTRDPLTFVAGTNHYLYAEADPINNADVYGLFTLTWRMVGIAAASVAAAALVVVFAPVAAPLAIILAGAAAGAVGAGLNEALNEKHLSLVCIAKAAGLGALAGAAAALPFLALPATAGIGLFMGAGALGGAMSYGVNCADGMEKNPSLAGLGASMLIGGATAGVLKGAGDAIFSGPAEGAVPETAAVDAAPETAIPGSSADQVSATPAIKSVSEPLTPSSPADDIEALKSSNTSSVASSKTFETRGLSENATDDYLDTPSGQEYLNQLQAADPNADAPTIYARASGQIQTGTTIPSMTESFSDPLVKAVPTGQAVSNYSPFFTTQSELNNAITSGKPLGDAFGLPLSSQAESYDIYQTLPPDGGGTIFTSPVAPTSELGGQFTTQGGQLQTLVPNRGGWSTPTQIVTIPAQGASPIEFPVQ